MKSTQARTEGNHTADKALRRLAAAFDHAPVPFALLDFPGFRVISLNQAMLSLLGFSNGEICSAHLEKELADADATPDGEGGKLFRLMEGAWQGKSAVTEALLMGGDGAPILCELYFSGLEENPGFPGEGRAMLLSIKDTRPEHHLRNLLQGTHDQLATIMDSSPVAAIAASLPGNRVLDSNHAAERLFTLTAGQPVNEIFADPDELQKIHDLLEKEGSVERYRALTRCTDGREHDCLFFVRRHSYLGQSSLLIWCLDVSELRRMEQELEEARLRADDAARARSDFLAHMSHELRTPMNGILGMSYLCLQTELSPHQRNYVQKIQSSAYALLSDINDILDFSQIERGELLLLHEPFTLQDVVGSLYARFEPQAREKGVELHLATAPDLTMPLMGDSTRITQMLGHLLGNALKFTEQGEINFSISLAEENEAWSRWSFTVRDTGMGMEPGLVAGLLQPFIQADTSMTRRFGGMGLGLTLTHRVLELLGGSLSVESAPGRGSAFHLSVPLEKASCSTAPELCILPEAPVLEQVQEKPQVLLVEDSEINQEIAIELLRNAGVDVDVADNGLKALEMLSQKTYALVFMDIQMPEMDGLEAARRIRAEGGTVPIVAMTAHSQPEDREKSLAAGMNDHITKPLKPDQLLHVLHGLVPVSHVGSDEGAPEDIMEASGESPAPDCLNPGQGLDTVGGNHELYHKLLRKFLETYAAVDIEVGRARELGDDALAKRLAHTVKNVAASLGMQPLSLAMIEVENHLKQDAAEGVEEALESLHTQLALARQAARDYLAASEQGQRCEWTPLSPESAACALDLLDGLPEFLEHDAGQAIERMDRLSELLECSPLAPLLAAVAREVENFDANRTRLAVQPLIKALRELG